ncbi:hypothetical protein ON010_g11854 [Phytophthora cinnamomi]|nr:hypothetical protein ON010_g11854 [Phytophthora cinnamomi]
MVSSPASNVMMFFKDTGKPVSYLLGGYVSSDVTEESDQSAFVVGEASTSSMSFSYQRTLAAATSSEVAISATGATDFIWAYGTSWPISSHKSGTNGAATFNIAAAAAASGSGAGQAPRSAPARLPRGATTRTAPASSAASPSPSWPSSATPHGGRAPREAHDQRARGEAAHHVHTDAGRPPPGRAAGHAHLHRRRGGAHRPAEQREKLRRVGPGQPADPHVPHPARGASACVVGALRQLVRAHRQVPPLARTHHERRSDCPRRAGEQGRQPHAQPEVRRGDPASRFHRVRVLHRHAVPVDRVHPPHVLRGFLLHAPRAVDRGLRVHHLALPQAHRSGAVCPAWTVRSWSAVPVVERLHGLVQGLCLGALRLELHHARPGADPEDGQDGYERQSWLVLPGASAGDLGYSVAPVLLHRDAGRQVAGLLHQGYGQRLLHAQAIGEGRHASRLFPTSGSDSDKAPKAADWYVLWSVREPEDILMMEQFLPTNAQLDYAARASVQDPNMAILGNNAPAPININWMFHVSNARTDGVVTRANGETLSYRGGQPILDELINTSRFNGRKVTVVACGPPTMTVTAQSLARNCNFDFHKEVFNWHVYILQFPAMRPALQDRILGILSWQESDSQMLKPSLNMGRKGVSLQEKRERILRIYHESKEVFNLKEVEKLGSKAGVAVLNILLVLCADWVGELLLVLPVQAVTVEEAQAQRTGATSPNCAGEACQRAAKY